MTECPFCSITGEYIAANNAALAIFDSFPVSRGHALIIPRRHVASFFDLSEADQAQVWSMVAEVQQKLETKFHPDGFNIGINDGVAAGQTVMHAHIHIIPRFKGDVPDPRGGVRWVIPRNADYWSKLK